MRVLVSEFISLDGVVQAPGGPEEDTSGGFTHGGWSLPFFDPEVMGPVISEFASVATRCSKVGVPIRCRRRHGPNAPAIPSPTGSTARRSTSFRDTLSDADLIWQPTTIIRGDELVERVSALREHPGGDIYVYGSLSLVRALLTAELLDELVLMIEPITLGGGKTLFPTDGAARNFELISAQTAATGVQVCRYRPAR